MKINRISPDKHDYLQITSVIADCPEKLNYIGKLPETRLPTVAIVGTRRPTAYGRDVTYRMAYDLAQRGIVIVSGLALGVDAISHQAALDASGTTIAVLANGLSHVYPRTNQRLADQIIASGGAIISEYDDEVEARGFQFLERNRIVSGLADAVVITEAAARSGTLNTAAHALEQGKNIFVVPGNITSALSAGCNSLLKQGAYPCTSVDDILAAIAPDDSEAQTTLPLGTTALETAIIELLRQGIRDGDEMQRTTKANASDFSMSLTMLELNGVIRALGANQWTLR